MRDQGRLVEWFDDRGYGFIQPNDLSKDRVFLHIKNFTRPGPRPIVGCALEYTVTIDAQSRYKATEVIYLKVNQIKKVQTFTRHAKKQTLNRTQYLQPMQILCVVYIIGISLLILFGLLKGYVALFLCLINILTYWCYAQDKAAQLGHRRISEQALHILAFLGGWPAAWLAQQKLRHKTQKQPFKKIYFCTIIFNLLFIIWLVSPLNHLNF